MCTALCLVNGKLLASLFLQYDFALVSLLYGPSSQGLCETSQAVNFKVHHSLLTVKTLKSALCCWLSILTSWLLMLPFPILQLPFSDFSGDIYCYLHDMLFSLSGFFLVLSQLLILSFNRLLRHRVTNMKSSGYNSFMVLLYYINYLLITPSGINYSLWLFYSNSHSWEWSIWEDDWGTITRKI